MEKIFIEVKCPAISESFEFRISKKLSVGEGLKKIISEIRLFCGNDEIFPDEDHVELFSDRINGVLNRTMSFPENGVRSGDQLMIL